ncbi:hypothetical protein ILYODFUR_001789 [Ilyodon furcidens]|uniref:Uncharacterized protein n=1 Tax=Ilyodon furcidens TaxID=33524 RepID=A0ABV0TGJ1_9TELE
MMWQDVLCLWKSMLEVIDIHSQVENNWTLHQVELKYATCYVKQPEGCLCVSQKWVLGRVVDAFPYSCREADGKMAEKVKQFLQQHSLSTKGSSKELFKLLCSNVCTKPVLCERIG